MRFALQDLHSGQFEDLVVDICGELLGPGVQGFATGPDGGRDAKFVGVADNFPSRADPLSGTTIVQAKHTSNPIGKFSDTDFSGTGATATLRKEIPRIRALRDAGKIDNYVLFSNRRLGAIANENITDLLKDETSVPVVHLVGVEGIERYVKRYPYLSTSLADFEYALPLRASPDDLAEVITAIAAAQPTLKWPESTSANSLERTAFTEKNRLNGLSEDYARTITRGFLKHFDVVKKFLADPVNARVYDAYRNAVDEFAAKLLAHRADFPVFDQLLEHLLSTLIERDGDLSQHKRITRTVFYYMYWVCDIGAEDERTRDA